MSNGIGWLSPVMSTGQESLAPLPSLQGHVSTLDVLRRQLACFDLSPDLPHEKRYPYLDRGLLEFVSAIPSEQLVRPGQRRSLMRRALIGVVPHEILNRKRKAFVTRGPRVSIAAELPRLLELSQHMLMSSFRIADSSRFVEALHRIRQGEDVASSHSCVLLALSFGCETLLPGTSFATSLVSADCSKTRLPVRRRRRPVRLTARQTQQQSETPLILAEQSKTERR